MKCDDAKYKIQALIDKELPEDEIKTVVSHIESCYNCREEYISMLKLESRLKGISFPEAEYDWYAVQRKKFLRKSFSFLGKILVFFSFLTLFVWGIIELVRNGNTKPIVQISILGLTLGAGILLFVSFSDRAAELKHDKYRRVRK